MDKNKLEEKKADIQERAKSIPVLNVEQVFELQNSLSLASNLRGVNFAYAISKNLGIVESYTKRMSEELHEKFLKPTEAFTKFDEARMELAKEFAQKDENGNPMTTHNGVGGESFVITEREKFDKEFEKLKEEHKEAVDERESNLKAYEGALKEPADIKLHAIRKEDLSPDITANILKGIKALIV